MRFVWVLDGFRRPQPQLWSDECNRHPYKRVNPIMEIHLGPEDVDKPFAELIQKYPAPEIGETYDV